MHPVLVALMAARKSSDSPFDADSALLVSGCQLLVSTCSTLVAATSVSCAVSSPEEGELLGVTARQLAAEYGLAATIMGGDSRFRARFARPQAGLEVPNGRT